MALGVEATDPHRDELGARRFHPGEAQVALVIDVDRGHLDGHPGTGIDHALLDQDRRAARHVDLVVKALGIEEPVRRRAGGHGRHQDPVAVLDLVGRRVREDRPGAARLIGRRRGLDTARPVSTCR